MKIEWFEIKYSFQRKWESVYYVVKDFFFPWNVIKLRRFKAHWTDTDSRMEEVILQLLGLLYQGAAFQFR